MGFCLHHIFRNNLSTIICHSNLSCVCVTSVTVCEEMVVTCDALVTCDPLDGHAPKALCGVVIIVLHRCNLPYHHCQSTCDPRVCGVPEALCVVVIIVLHRRRLPYHQSQLAIIVIHRCNDSCSPAIFRLYGSRNAFDLAAVATPGVVLLFRSKYRD